MPLGSALACLLGDDESERLVEIDIGDRRTHRDDPDGEQGQAELLPAPGTHPPPGEREKQLVRDHEREEVQEELARQARHGEDAEAQKHHRSEKVDDRSETGQIAPHGGEIHESLRNRHPLLMKRILEQHHLHGALRPAQPLRERGAEVFGGQADRQYLVVVMALPPHAVQTHRGSHILGDRDGCQRHERLGFVVAIDIDRAQQLLHRPDGTEWRQLAAGQQVHACAHVQQHVPVAVGFRPQFAESREVFCHQPQVSCHERSGDGRDIAMELISRPGDGRAVCDVVLRAMNSCGHLEQGAVHHRILRPFGLQSLLHDLRCAAKPRMHGALHLGHVLHDAELHERLPPQDCVRTAEEGGIPAILTLLDRPIEQWRLAAQRVFVGHISKFLRGLHEGDERVVEIPEGGVEDARIGDLVGVEDEHELSVGRHQGIVEVAGLRVQGPIGPVIPAFDVSDADLLGREAHLIARTVIENPGLVRIADVSSCPCCLDDHLDRLVVGGDEHVDRQSVDRRGRLRSGARPPHGHREQCDVDQAVSLGENERDGDPPGFEIEREEHSPHHVIEAGDDGHHRQNAQQKYAAGAGVDAGRALIYYDHDAPSVAHRTLPPSALSVYGRYSRRPAPVVGHCREKEDQTE